MRARGVVEKPKPEEAPSNLAVIGRYVFTPAIFDVLRETTPGVGGEIQLTDAIAILLEREPVFGVVFTKGRYDVGRRSTSSGRTSSWGSRATICATRSSRCCARSCAPVGSGRRRVALVPLEDTRAAIEAVVPRLPVVQSAIADAVGLVLASEIVTPEPVPPFANSAMDGYAVRASDTTGADADSPVRLIVVDELPAGRAPAVPVGPGEAIRIMTGAPMPDGADAIVMVECHGA